MITSINNLGKVKSKTWKWKIHSLTLTNCFLLLPRPGGGDGVDIVPGTLCLSPLTAWRLFIVTSFEFVSRVGGLHSLLSQYLLTSENSSRGWGRSASLPLDGLQSFLLVFTFDVCGVTQRSAPLRHDVKRVVRTHHLQPRNEAWIFADQLIRDHFLEYFTKLLCKTIPD